MSADSSCAGYSLFDRVSEFRTECLRDELHFLLGEVDGFREALGQLRKGSAAAFSVMRQSRRGEERFLFITPRIPAVTVPS